jgi:hypothetical protein
MKSGLVVTIAFMMFLLIIIVFAIVPNITALVASDPTTVNGFVVAAAVMPVFLIIAVIGWLAWRGIRNSA